jgi:dihydrofolate reductase
MQPLTVDFITSLDGYAAAKGWPGLWGMGGPEYFTFLDQSPVKDHPVLMGANTYRLMYGFAEQAGDEPGFAELNAVQKYVFSSTLRAPLEWANSTVVDGDPVDAVRRLKEQAPTPLRTLGSLTLCRTLLSAGLVDRFRVVVFPVINGLTGYDRIYDGYPEVALELVEHRTFDGQLQLLEYIPTVLDGPPGDGSTPSGS